VAGVAIASWLRGVGGSVFKRRKQALAFVNDGATISQQRISPLTIAQRRKQGSAFPDHRSTKHKQVSVYLE